MLDLAWLTDAPADVFTGVAPALFAVVAIAATAFAATRLTRLAIHRTIRRLARRGMRAGADGGPGPWRVRAIRISGETGETWEQRRRQRIDAASGLLNHLVSVAIWIVAAIVAFHVLAVDPTLLLSGAGFIGVGLAIGGQHKVNDYLTGLNVHFEDRYGVGDEIVVNPADGGQLQAVVDHVGLFSTRLRDERGALHLPNHSLLSIRNLSQEPVTTTLRINVPDHSAAGDAASLLRGLAGDDGLTDVVLVAEPCERDAGTGRVDIDVRTSRRLEAPARDRLVERAEQAMWRR